LAILLCFFPETFHILFCFRMFTVADESIFTIAVIKSLSDNCTVCHFRGVYSNFPCLFEIFLVISISNFIDIWTFWLL
jgi:hypothetical protein